MELPYLMGCLHSLNDVYSHLWKIKVFWNKINKISIIVRVLFPCDSNDILQICFLRVDSCIWELDWVRIHSDYSSVWGKKKYFTFLFDHAESANINPLKPELNSICYLLALLGAHHFLNVSRIRVKLLTFRLQMSYIYGAPILDVSRSHTTTQHSR